MSSLRTFHAGQIQPPQTLLQLPMDDPRPSIEASGDLRSGCGIFTQRLGSSRTILFADLEWSPSFPFVSRGPWYKSTTPPRGSPFCPWPLSFCMGTDWNMISPCLPQSDKQRTILVARFWSCMNCGIPCMLHSTLPGAFNWLTCDAIGLRAGCCHFVKLSFKKNKGVFP